MKKKYFIFLILFSSTFILNALYFYNTAHGSTIILQKPNQIFGVGDEFSVPVTVETNGDEINAISLDITFSDNTLSVARILYGNSVVSYWIEAPHVSGNAVLLSGIIPGGYKETIDPLTNKSIPSTVAQIVFKVDKPGVGKIDFSDARSYLNDSKGAESKIITSPLILFFSEKGLNNNEPLKDIIAPTKFDPIIVTDKLISKRKTLVVFNTTDKESGIDYYEVDEGNGVWIRSDSPHVISNLNNYSRTIRVKAVDKAGNYTIGVVQYKSKSSYLFIFITILVLIFLGFIYFFIRNHIKHHKTKLNNQ